MTAQTHYVIYANDEDGPNGLTEKSAKTGDGTDMADFLFTFDGSGVVYEFPMPPDVDPFYEGMDVMELRGTQRWVLAQAIQRAYRAGFELGRDHLVEEIQELVRRFDNPCVDTDDLIRICEKLKTLVPPQPSEEEDDEEEEET